MRILVIGASGRVGEELVSDLSQAGYHVSGTYNVKKPQHQLEHAIQLNLADSTVPQIAEKIHGYDIVYFVAGSRGKDLLQTDLYGSVKVMKALETSTHVDRYVQLSASFSLHPELWQTEELKPLRNFYIAKYFSDCWLLDNTTLNYTILQPGMLLSTKGTGKIELNPKHRAGIPIADVALTLAKLAEHPNTAKKIITVHSGEEPIDGALAKV